MDLWQWHCRNRREKKLFQLVCGNAIAEIGRKKFVAMPLSKMGGKKNSGCQNHMWGIKKKKMLRLQYFYNKSQMVSYYLFKFETNTKITFLP